MLQALSTVLLILNNSLDTTHTRLVCTMYIHWDTDKVYIKPYVQLISSYCIRFVTNCLCLTCVDSRAPPACCAIMKIVFEFGLNCEKVVSAVWFC